jgi:hypothetical protein
VYHGSIFIIQNLFLSHSVLVAFCHLERKLVSGITYSINLLKVVQWRLEGDAWCLCLPRKWMNAPLLLPLLLWLNFSNIERFLTHQDSLYFLFTFVPPPSFVMASFHLSPLVASMLWPVLFPQCSLTWTQKFFDTANFRDSFLAVIFRAICLQLLLEARLSIFVILLFLSTHFSISRLKIFYPLLRSFSFHDVTGTL